MAEQQPVQVC